ncbi:MAG: type IX secretion system membrane protein PorP/SprF [Flavobacteriales bacterium]|nr:type IX secretion system membrane protein PorP/SprF [Flavobacteriales bacterium]
METKRIFRTIVIAILSLVPLIGAAQQEALFTHSSFNTLEINPAYAGSREALSVSALHRSQWVSFEGAPITQNITVHSPFINENFGAGISVLNDAFGPVRRTAFFADFAYRFNVAKDAKLAFGLKAGLNLLTANYADLKLTDDAVDLVYQSNIENKAVPNLGAGVYYYTPDFYAGFSIPRMLSGDKTFNNSGNKVGSESKHYIFISGAIIKMNRLFDFKPGTIVRVTKGAPVVVDLTAVFEYDELLWAGLMYRTHDALGFLGGVNITDQFKFGYAYDWSFGFRTGTYNKGSHEVLLKYDLIFENNKKVSSSRNF